MESINRIQPDSDLRSEGRFIHWCRILRAHYHWPLFEAIRYALWLAR